MKSKIASNAGKWLVGLLCCLAIPSQAAVLVNLDATGLPLGALPTWTNTGSVAGNFVATGAPSVTLLSGVRAVTLAGSAEFYAGPIAPDGVAGINPSRTIEVWAFNPVIAGEESLFAWGRRDGPDGTNISFNYGNSATFGAVGQWGGSDMGWNNAGGAPSAGFWHYLVYTYDGGGVAAAGTTRVYSDGVLQNSEFAGNLNTYTGTQFVLGGQNSAAGVPAGLNSGLSIARVRVHDVALTAQQIAAQFAAELPQIHPTAFLTSSKILSSSSFGFTIQDIAPASVTNPTSFTVSVAGVRGGWQVLGGDGVFESSITSPPITVAGGGALELTFQHRYNFEDEFDGGFIQYNIDGQGWMTVENTAFTQNGYKDAPLIGTGFQLGRQGFNGISAGYTSSALIVSVASLPAVAPGATVQLRFLGTWDEGFSPDGLDWEITQITLKSGATIVSNVNFATGNSGYESEVINTGAAKGLPWSYVQGFQPVLGTLVAAKSGEVLTLTQPIQWVPGRDYSLTIRGKNTTSADLVYQTLITTPSLPLAPAISWPTVFPGPLGTVGNWGIRTYLNNGLNSVETLQPMLDFLMTAADRTPALTPESVVDSFATGLNFADKDTNATLQGVLSSSPLAFPGEALSRSTNGGASRDDNHVITSAHGSIQITETSDYTFNIHCDDGYVFRIKSATGAPPKFIAVNGPSLVDSDARHIIYFPSGTGDANTRAVVHLTPGIYKLEFAQWEGAGGFYYQISTAKGFFLNDTDTDQWAPFNQINSRTTPIPYPSMVGNWTVQSTPSGGSALGTIAGADAAVSAAVTADPVAATSIWPEINFQDPEAVSVSRIAGDSPFPGNSAGDDNNFALRTSGTLHIPEDGNYLIGYQGDDGSKLTIGGVHSGFSALTENVSGAGVIGRENTVAVNTGSLGAAANFSFLTSAVWSRPGAIVGDTNNGISVTATDAQKMRVPFLSSLNPATSFSVEIWVKPSVIPAGLTCAVSSGNFADPRSGWLIYMDPAAGWSFRGYANAGLATAFNASGGSIPVAGQWYHLVGTWDSNTSTAALYVNAVLAGSAVATPAYANATVALSNGSLNIGSRADAAFGWEGDADELAIYPAALAPATVTAHYDSGLNAARSTPYPSLVAASNPLGYWRLNETRQPRVDLGTLTTDLPTGDSSTVGRIFLTAGDYPISSIFFEIGGGASYEIFAARDLPNVAFKSMRNGGWPSISVPASGLPMVDHPAPVPAVLLGGLKVNADKSFNLAFLSVPYATYTLQTSTDLVVWEDILSDFEALFSSTVVQGDPNTFFFYYDPADKKRFYRIKANP